MEGSVSNLRDNDNKPLIVRVKRKVSQCAIDALWLEVSERKAKRPLIDFGKLSLSDASSSSRVEELKKTKILVEHVETVNSTKEAFHVLQSFLDKSSDELGSLKKVEKERLTIKSANRREQLLAKSKQSQEESIKNARFEQIWRRRKGNNEVSEDESIHEMCKLYDVVRVDDGEAAAAEVHDKSGGILDLDDSMMLAKYLPLLREVLPSAAAEIESGTRFCLSEEASEDDYVYDVYTVKEDTEADFAGPFPLVKVEYDDDFYDGATESEYQSDDSNAENHPQNDYPDEETSEDDGEMSGDSDSDNEIRDSEDEGSEEDDSLSSDDDDRDSCDVYERSASIRDSYFSDRYDQHSPFSDGYDQHSSFSDEFVDDDGGFP